MNMLPLLIIGLSQFAAYLTFMHFVLTFSEQHAMVLFGLYILQKFGEIQLLRSSNNNEEPKK